MKNSLSPRSYHIMPLTIHMCRIHVEYISALSLTRGPSLAGKDHVFPSQIFDD